MHQVIRGCLGFVSLVPFVALATGCGNELATGDDESSTEEAYSHNLLACGRVPTEEAPAPQLRVNISSSERNYEAYVISLNTNAGGFSFAAVSSGPLSKVGSTYTSPNGFRFEQVGTGAAVVVPRAGREPLRTNLPCDRRSR